MFNPLLRAFLEKPQMAGMSITFSAATGLDPVLTGGTSVVWTSTTGATSTGTTPSPALAYSGKWDITMDDFSAVTALVADDDTVTQVKLSTSNSALATLTLDDNAGLAVNTLVDDIYAIRTLLPAMTVDISGTCPNISNASFFKIKELQDNFSHSWSYNIVWSPNIDTFAFNWIKAGGSDASTITSSGGLVSNISDKTSNNDIIQGNSGNQLQTGVDTIAGKNVLTSSGGDWMSASGVSMPSSGNFAVYMFAECDSASSGNASLVAMDATNDFQFEANDTPDFDGRVNVSGLGSSVNLSSPPHNGPSVYSLVFDYDNSTYSAYVDGVLRASSTTYTTKIDSSVELIMFASRSKAHTITGKFAEWIVTEDVTSATQSNYETYLTNEWTT